MNITVPESSLFLLLLAANVDAELTEGELTESEEALILRCANKWQFYDDFYSQSELEAAIQKYQELKQASDDYDWFIEQCAGPLLTSPPHRDMTYYLCVQILFLGGRIAKDSREDDLIGKLERILDVSPAVADFIFGLEIMKTVLGS